MIFYSIYIVFFFTLPHPSSALTPIFFPWKTQGLPLGNIAEIYGDQTLNVDLFITFFYFQLTFFHYSTTSNYNILKNKPIYLPYGSPLAVSAKDLFIRKIYQISTMT